MDGKIVALIAISLLAGCNGKNSDGALSTGAELSGEEIVQAFSNVRDIAAIQDSENTTAENFWYADGHFVNNWQNAEQSGTVRGRWSVQRGQRCVFIESGIEGLVGEQRCGAIVKQGSEYLSFNPDGTVHARHTLSALSPEEIDLGSLGTSANNN